MNPEDALVIAPVRVAMDLGAEESTTVTYLVVPPALEEAARKEFGALDWLEIVVVDTVK